jgi:transposase
MKIFKVPNRDQKLLFINVDLNTVAPVGSPLHVIDQLVDSLNTIEIEKEYDLETETGREPFHPKTFIKVSLYAIHNCRFSLRKMEYDTENHLGYRWLTGDEKIDHSTIGKFLSKYRNQITDLFSQVVMIGVEKELLNFDLLAIDTVKIRANATYKRFRNKEGLAKEKEKIESKISDLLEKVNINAEDEIKTLLKKELIIEEAARELNRRIEAKIEKNKNRKEKIEKTEKINITDFDCRLVQQANGEINSGYCITATTDTENDFITSFITNENNDAEILIEAIEESKKNTGALHEIDLADSGFSSIENLEILEGNGQKALIPDRRFELEQNGKTKKGDYDRCKFKYNEAKDEYKCPLGRKLSYNGSCANNERTYDKYENKSACKNCHVKNECTKHSHRIISRDANEKIKEQMREKLKKKRNKKKYVKRAHSAESPFGQIKHNLKFRIFMRRGIEKIKMECALLFSLHNILKIGKSEYGFN